MKPFAKGVLLLAIIAAGADMPGGPGTAFAESQNDNLSSANSVMPLSAGATHEWTREEMLKARPLLPKKPRGPAVREIPAVDKMSVGIPGAIPGGLPGGVELKASAENVPDVTVTATAKPLSYTYPPPFTRYQNFDQYTIYPYKTVGKLFFKLGTDSYVCSAASIGNYAIWTAGHCVFDPDTQTWASNMVFVPAYKNGAAPLGQWPAARMLATTAWKNDGDLRYDMGGAVLRPKLGVKISQRVGWLGFAWNHSVEQHWFALGYPAASPFDGKTQQVCTASYAYSDTSYGSPPYPNGMGCDQTGGSSGGPWIIQFGSNNYLNGQVSYGYDGSPEEMFSPYFGNEAKSLYDDLIVGRP